MKISITKSQLDELDSRTFKRDRSEYTAEEKNNISLWVEDVLKNGANGRNVLPDASETFVCYVPDRPEVKNWQDSIQLKFMTLAENEPFLYVNTVDQEFVKWYNNSASMYVVIAGFVDRKARTRVVDGKEQTMVFVTMYDRYWEAIEFVHAQNNTTAGGRGKFR